MTLEKPLRPGRDMRLCWTPEKDIGRKRKAHKKSRSGCGNCKMRKVKCDEGKPECRRCTTFGIKCTYDRVSSDLQPRSERAFLVNPTSQLSPAVSLNHNVLGRLNESLRRQDTKNRAFQLGNHDLSLLNRFHERTGRAVGNEETCKLYATAGARLASEHPFLMHIVLTMTMMHDHACDPTATQSSTAMYRWYDGTSQFNAVLSSPHLTSSQRDAVWVSAVLLGCTSLAQVDERAPEEVWPLKSPCTSDLEWLKLSAGEEQAWQLAALHRPDSALRALARQQMGKDFLSATTDKEALRSLPAELVSLCELDPDIPMTNPYFHPATILGRLLPLAVSQSSILKFLTFLSHIRPDFRALLEQKDPRAMLLLYYYYAKVGEYTQWWWWKRAALEGRAMRIYLETYHGNIPHLARLLDWPGGWVREEGQGERRVWGTVVGGWRGMEGDVLPRMEGRREGLVVSAS